MRPGFLTKVFSRYLSVESTFGYSFHFGLEDSDRYKQIAKEVCEALIAGVTPKYMIPPTAADFKLIADEFSKKWSLPNCVGAVGCKNVKLRVPENVGADFKEEQHCISVVALCDAKFCFTIAEVDYLGSKSDGSAFKHSNLGQSISGNSLATPPPSKLPKSKGDQQFNYFAVGANNLSLRENFMIPYPKASLNDQDEKLRYERRIFNFRLSRATRVADNAFGVMVCRWKKMQKRLAVPVDTAILYVRACICLHNYIMKTRTSNNNGMGTFGDVYGAKDRLSKPGRWRGDSSPWVDTMIKSNKNPTLEARKRRDVLAKYLSYENTLDYQVEVSNASKAPRAKKQKLQD